jgi:hypothetical protein
MDQLHIERHKKIDILTKNKCIGSHVRRNVQQWEIWIFQSVKWINPNSRVTNHLRHHHHYSKRTVCTTQNAINWFAWKQHFKGLQKVRLSQNIGYLLWASISSQTVRCNCCEEIESCGTRNGQILKGGGWEIHISITIVESTKSQSATVRTPLRLRHDSSFWVRTVSN